MVAMVLSVLMATATAADRVVARLGDTSITHNMIACRDAASPRCHEVEQQNLDHLFFQTFIDAAARRRGIDVTTNEINQSPYVPRSDFIARTVARQRKLIEAVQRVRSGEDPHVVYERDLHPAAITETEFNSYRTLFNNDARIRSALSQDLAAGYYEAARKSARKILVLRKLQERIASEAAARGQSPAVAEDAMWRETASSLHPAVLDPSFHEPDLKGALHAEKTVALH